VARHRQATSQLAGECGRQGAGAACPLAHGTGKNKPPCGCPCAIHGPRRLATAAPLSAVARHRLATSQLAGECGRQGAGAACPLAHGTRKSKPPCGCPCSIHGPWRLATAAPLSAVARHRQATSQLAGECGRQGAGAACPLAHGTGKNKPPCDGPCAIHGPWRLATATP